MKFYRKYSFAVCVINHHHDELIYPLVRMLEAFDQVVQIIVIDNSKSLSIPAGLMRTDVYTRDGSYGFADNNNYGFCMIRGNVDYFVCCNPDISFLGNPFEKFNDLPMRFPVLAPSLLEDNDGFSNWRSLPTLLGTLRRILSGSKRSDSDPKWHSDLLCEIEAATGAFLIFEVNTYKRIGGFRDDYFMYFEDMDLCRRLKGMNIPLYGYRTDLISHLARRDNRRNPRHMYYYSVSLIRYFFNALINNYNSIR